MIKCKIFINKVYTNFIYLIWLAKLMFLDFHCFAKVVYFNFEILINVNHFSSMQVFIPKYSIFINLKYIILRVSSQNLILILSIKKKIKNILFLLIFFTYYFAN